MLATNYKVTIFSQRNTWNKGWTQVGISYVIAPTDIVSPYNSLFPTLNLIWNLMSTFGVITAENILSIHSYVNVRLLVTQNIFSICFVYVLSVGVLAWWIWLLIALAVVILIIAVVLMMCKHHKDSAPLDVPDTTHMVLDNYDNDQLELQEAEMQIFDVTSSLN